MSPAKATEPIKILFGLWTRMDPRNYILDGGPDSQGAILGGKGGHCKV